MIIQLCGMSGAGKSTISGLVEKKLSEFGVAAEIIDGDDYRRMLCRDLGFSKADRCENIRRLGFVASKFSAQGIVAIICAINPYNEIRAELASSYNNVQTVFIDCTVNTLIKRDTKGLYAKALLPEGHPDKINNLTGINDPFDIPTNPDLHINTARKKKEACAEELFSFIMQHLSSDVSARYFTTRIAV
ncbi:MAG: adenylyl-sulfate kinase [Chitinophagaceae bacterium]